MITRSLWLPGMVVVIGVLAFALPWCVHFSTATDVRRWFTVPNLLASLTIMASTVWAVVTVVDGGPPSHALPAAATGVLVAGADHVRRRSGLDPHMQVLPRWFVPILLVLAATSGVAVNTGAAVAGLVMATPAAAILAAPVAFGVGARRARSAGILLGDLGTIDAATRVDTLVLEKDGTLTTGDLTVISVDPDDPDHDRNIRWFAGALEKASEHRVGRAIAELSAPGRLDGVEVVPGQGIRGSVDRHPVRVGSPAWVGVHPPDTIWTAVGVEVDGRPLGTITVADDVRPDVATDVARVAGLGLDVILVSADTLERTRHVADLASVSTVHAVRGPADVPRLVNSLTEQGRRVATVGTSRVTGAQLTISSVDEAGDGPTIIAEDCSPARVADALQIARGTAARITQARRVSVVLSLLGAAVGATGVAGPVIAAAVATAIVGIVAIVATRP